MYFEQILLFKHHLGLHQSQCSVSTETAYTHNLQNHTICAKRKNYTDWATKHKHT